MKTIIMTTDGKYLGVNIDPTDSSITFEDWVFTPIKITDLGNGHTRYSNTSYVVIAKDNN